MCSMTEPRSAEIAEAIDKLAADQDAGTALPEMAARVAAVWAMFASADPAVARLMTRYENRDR